MKARLGAVSAVPSNTSIVVRRVQRRRFVSDLLFDLCCISKDLGNEGWTVLSAILSQMVGSEYIGILVYMG